MGGLRKLMTVLRAAPPTSGEMAARTQGKEIARLRLTFLVPLVAVISIIVIAYVASLYHREYEYLRLGTVRLNTSANELYRDGLNHSAVVLRTVMGVVAHDESLRAALARKDAPALLRRAGPIFDDLKKDYNITHFYFSGPDRVNLLRVHNPPRHGDVINRVTTLLAERDGKLAHGVELGPYGTFTLRLVGPWYEERTRRLLGYVEFGMEIDSVLGYLRDFFGVETYVVIRKEFLKRETWEEGMRMLGHAATDWDRFPGVALGPHGARALPPVLVERFAHDGGSGEPLLDIRPGQAPYRAVFVPLRDISGREVGQMALLADVSQELETTRRRVYVGSAVVLVTGGLLGAFFFWLAGRVGRRIEHDEKELQRLATHDGLTGLYNHRTFYALLEDEIARAKRFNRPVSLLMLDIDHFKHVNDTHGHLAGDAILKSLSELLTRQARAIDRVCRYGGEEITAILPETENAAALNIAERLRATVEREQLDIGDGRIVSVTVSIGLASWPAQAGDAETLVAAADTAMYAAKQAGRNRVCRYEPGLRVPGD